MKKQFAVFGLGSFGESVAVTLQQLGCEVVAVDNHMEHVQEISEQVPERSVTCSDSIKRSEVFMKVY